MSTLYHESNGNMKSIEAVKYSSESELQSLIENNPGLIARNDEEQLLLVRSEWQTGSGPLDHLFLDVSCGMLVLVEDKLSTNGEIRRKVMGQITDYASHVTNWDIESIKTNFYASNPEAKGYTDDFWDLVKDNMKHERIRMVFASDHIPLHLREIIAFNQRNYNEKVEWYGVEINRHYFQNGQGKERPEKDKLVFVTRQLIGDVKEKKVSSSRVLQEKWDLHKTQERIASLLGAEQKELVTRIISDLKDIGYLIDYGKGEKEIRISAKIDSNKVLELGLPKKKFMIMAVTKSLVSLCEGTYSKEEIEKMLTSLPVQNSAYAKECRIGRTAVSIDLSQLENDENREYLMAVLRELFEKADKE